MAEIGIDLSRAFPKRLTTDAVQAADLVTTMGCGDACPVFPGRRYLDWQLPDPAGETVDEVRSIRDDIGTRVRDLLTDILAAPASQPDLLRSAELLPAETGTAVALCPVYGEQVQTGKTS